MIAMQQSVHNLCKGPPFPLLLMGYWACTVHAAWTDQKVKVSGQGTSIDLSVATPEHRISFSTYILVIAFPAYLKSAQRAQHSPLHCGPNILSSLFSPIHLQSQPSAHLCHLITFHNSSQSPACILLCTHPFHKIAHHP